MLHIAIGWWIIDFSVLNEVITDIDELLDKPEYQEHIEKIKTISATFIGASGLQASRTHADSRHCSLYVSY